MKHRIVVAGLGGRGKIHLKGILENPERFELAGIFDPKEEAVKIACEQFNIKPELVFSSAEEMLGKTKPEVLAFVTHPQIRKQYIELGIKNGVKSISFEKPMAVSLEDAREITRLCVDNKIKAVVSHQQKYMQQMQEMYKTVRSGIIGQTELIRIFMRCWASKLATHFIDYALWANGGVGAEWVVGHVSGRYKLNDNHPSPDYMMGEARLKNGATLLVESGYLAPFTLPDEDFYTNNRITVYGSHGYAWAETNGRFGTFSPETGSAEKVVQYTFWNEAQHGIQTPYYTELADWLDNDNKKHSCNIETSLHGYEIMEGIYKSALENTRVDLPIKGVIKDAIAEMKKVLPEETYPENFREGNFYKLGTQVK
jgi:predicted dehydrogenase